MTPDQMKKARAKLQITQEGLAAELDKSDRFITYRESGKRPIDRMLEYAIRWMSLPKAIKDKFPLD